MKFICFLFILVSAFSCESHKEPDTSYLKSNRAIDSIFTPYWVICTLKNIDNGNIVKDSSGLLVKTDSEAYLYGLKTFGRFKVDWNFARYHKRMPLSFIVMRNQQNIIDNLSSNTLNNLDSISKIEIEREKNAIYDSLGNIRDYGVKGGLSDTIDSISKYKISN